MGFPVAIRAKSHAIPYAVASLGAKDVVNIENACVRSRKPATRALAHPSTPGENGSSHPRVTPYTGGDSLCPFRPVTTDVAVCHTSEVINGIVRGQILAAR